MGIRSPRQIRNGDTAAIMEKAENEIAKAGRN
jgi:hypothetical protein